MHVGDLVQCEGLIYRSRENFNYCLPECNPAHPVGCDWFDLVGACD